MPHIKADRREACLNLPQCKERGEIHFFFGQQMQAEFIKNPCYLTLSSLRLFWVQTAHRQEYFKKIRQMFRVPLDVILNEAAMAWEVFMGEVGLAYEEVKAYENGHAYDQALKLVGEKFKEAKRLKESTALIVPGEKK